MKFKGIELEPGDIIKINGTTAALIGFNNAGIVIMNVALRETISESSVKTLKLVMPASEAVPLHARNPEFVKGAKVKAKCSGTNYVGIIIAAIEGVIIATTNGEQMFWNFSPEFKLA